MFIELTDNKNNKVLININQILRVHPTKDVTTNLPNGCNVAVYGIPPAQVTQSYDEIKQMILAGGIKNVDTNHEL